MSKNIVAGDKAEIDEIFINVRVPKDSREVVKINKNIKDTTYKERFTWYNSIGKGQVVSYLEKVGGWKID